jgi:hypothetical protein
LFSVLYGEETSKFSLATNAVFQRLVWRSAVFLHHVTGYMALILLGFLPETVGLTGCRGMTKPHKAGLQGFTE